MILYHKIPEINFIKTIRVILVVTVQYLRIQKKVNYFKIPSSDIS